MIDRDVDFAAHGMEPLTRMELAISYVLRAGVLLSAAIILTGILLVGIGKDTGYAAIPEHGMSGLLSFHEKQGPGFFPTSLHEVIDGTMAGKPYAIICLGMMILIATPVIRVALSVFFFLSQGDRLYVGITLLVLFVLLLSLFSGIG